MNPELKEPAKFIDINSNVTVHAVQAATNLCKEEKITRSGKTPISLLQEIATKCSCQPLYENISTEGHVHDPLFVYKVTVGGISAVANGSSKKAAKHAAALSILNEIRMKSVGQNDNLASKIEYLLQSIKEANLDDRPKEYTDGGASDDSTISSDLTNPVGTLLELTQKYSLRPPAFTFTVEDAEPHNTKFICHTKFGEFTEETGTGRSKKIAKRNAALKLINKLKNSQDFKDLKLEKTNAELTELTSGAKDKNKKSGANVFSMLKSSSKPTIVTLLEKSTNPSDNLTDEALTKETFVQLAKEENLVYNFFNLGKNKAGLHQILLQIKSNPCLVMNGRGITWNEALSDASYNVLSLIKLLCNR